MVHSLSIAPGSVHPPANFRTTHSTPSASIFVFQHLSEYRMVDSLSRIRLRASIGKFGVVYHNITGGASLDT